MRAWVEKTLATYSPDAVKFFRKEGNRFANPVGTTITGELGPLFDLLVQGVPPSQTQPHLDKLIQIRCIQELSPSQAVSFIFQLKDILRETLGRRPGNPEVDARLIALFLRIDRLAMQAFDTYTTYRDRVWEVRVKEIKRRVSTIVRMSKLSPDDLDPGLNPQDANI